MSTFPSIPDLHKAGIRARLPRRDLHAIIKDIAFTLFAARSLKDLDGPQRLAVEQAVLRLAPPTPAQPDRPTRRASRSGKDDGNFRMITPAQRGFILKLAGEMNWTRSTLKDFLKTHFGVEEIIKLASTANASKCINMLIGFKKSKERKKHLSYEI